MLLVGAHPCPCIIVSDHTRRELVITVPLPEDAGLDSDGRPKVRRFRSRHLDLGVRLAAFGARYGVTQAEIARAVGARDHAAVSQWERGATVPEGMLRERLVALLDGRRRPELRAAMLGEDGGWLPTSWDRAVRWYRRASRERRHRATIGMTVAAILGELQRDASAEALRRDYLECDGDWAATIVALTEQRDAQPLGLRRVEDAAHGLRWLELAHGRRFDLGRSLVSQLPLALLDGATDAQHADGECL